MTALRFLSGAALGLGAALLLPRGEDSHTPAPPLDLRPGTRAAVHTGSALAPWGLGLLGVATGVAGAQAVGSRKVSDVVGAALAAAVTVGLRRVEVIVDARGVTLYSAIPQVSQTIALDSIRSARATEVTAAEFTGLGLRWSAERGVGLILRSGPALTLELAHGPLTITADDAANAAALLEHLIAERRDTTSSHSTTSHSTTHSTASHSTTHSATSTHEGGA